MFFEAILTILVPTNQPTNQLLTVKDVEYVQRKENHPEKGVPEGNLVDGVDEEDVDVHDYIGKEVESNGAE